MTRLESLRQHFSRVAAVQAERYENAMWAGNARAARRANDAYEDACRAVSSLGDLGRVVGQNALPRSRRVPAPSQAVASPSLADDSPEVAK